MGGAGNADVAGFERLAQRLEYAAFELRQLVEEQHAALGHRDLPRTRPLPPAHHPGQSDGAGGRATDPSLLWVGGTKVEVVRRDIKNLHWGVYPPLGRVRVAVPLVGATLAGLLSGWRASGAQGVSNVMEAVALGRVRLSLRATSRRIAGSWMAIATGLSIGREGPLIEFGGAPGARPATRRT